MGGLIDILKSKGKTGGVGLMLIGLAEMALVYFGKIQGDYNSGASHFFLGLGLFGIRGALDR